MRLKFSLAIALIVLLLRIDSQGVKVAADPDVAHQNVPDEVEYHQQYPNAVPVVPIRKDIHTGEPVSRGRLELLGGFATLPEDKRVTLEEFRKALQCAPTEPGLDGNRGSIGLMRLLPPTKSTIELMAVWAETYCSTWLKCNEELAKFRNHEEGRGNGTLGGRCTSPFQLRLLRIINNEVYYDWPWGNRERMKPPSITRVALIQFVLGKLHGLGDSVFLQGEETAYLPFNIPFPGFSYSPSFKDADLPWPWIEYQHKEGALYREAFGTPERRANLSIGAAVYDEYHSKSYEEWALRESKAAFYGTMSPERYLFFDSALKRTDLIAAGWTGGSRLKAGWNPQSKEPPLDEAKIETLLASNPNSTTTGMIQTVLRNHIKHSENFMSHRFKYLVVLLGGIGTASADRLPMLLAHSGAVILIQMHGFEYHFSPRLKPWVHYVPLTFSATDVIEKVEWLKQHDRVAYRIAVNARNFGISYLRLEDMACYVASALHQVHSILNTTDALEPFDPVLIGADEIKMHNNAHDLPFLKTFPNLNFAPLFFPLQRRPLSRGKREPHLVETQLFEGHFNESILALLKAWPDLLKIFTSESFLRAFWNTFL